MTVLFAFKRRKEKEVTMRGAMRLIQRLEAFRWRQKLSGSAHHVSRNELDFGGCDERNS
jgi:hypothetical protein